MPRTIELHKNVKAFLDMLAVSEIGEKQLANSDDGYNVIVGGSLFDDNGTVDLFDDYKDHPNKRIYLSKLDIYSTAAGRYQVLKRYFDVYKKQLKLPDFSPYSQDRIAVQILSERRCLVDLYEGRFEVAVKKCANIWASLPGAGYGQHENKIERLKAAYIKAGGVIK